MWTLAYGPGQRFAQRFLKSTHTTCLVRVDRGDHADDRCAETDVRCSRNVHASVSAAYVAYSARKFVAANLNPSGFMSGLA